MENDGIFCRFYLLFLSVRDRINDNAIFLLFFISIF